MKDLIINFLRFLPDQLYVHLIYFYKTKRLLNLGNPKTFNEKINYIKLNSKNRLRYKIVDRIWVRDYVKERAPRCKLIPLIWHGKEFTGEVYASLPEEFFIKGNHGSKMVKHISKNSFSFEEIVEISNDWLRRDYSLRGRERVYGDLDRYLIVESKLTFEGDIPPDYKFFCFNGKVKFVQVDVDRYRNHRRSIFDTEFNLMAVNYSFQNAGPLKKPVLFEDAICIAESLSQDFSFIRVDLFILEDGIYFGELTNFPGNGLEMFEPHVFDEIFGNYIEVLE